MPDYNNHTTNSIQFFIQVKLLKKHLSLQNRVGGKGAPMSYIVTYSKRNPVAT